MNDWIEWKWTEEKPYPETLDTVLTHVRFRDGTENETCADVGWWYSSGEGSNWCPDQCYFGNDIVAYRVVS